MEVTFEFTPINALSSPPSIFCSLLSSKSKQLKAFRKSLKLTRSMRPFPLQVYISGEDYQETIRSVTLTLCIAEWGHTTRAAWEDILQLAEPGCAVCFRLSALMSCHSFWGRLWWYNSLPVILSNSSYTLVSNPSKIHCFTNLNQKILTLVCHWYPIHS